MLIGVDAACWWNKRGFGRFTRGLLRAMIAEPQGHRFRFFVDQPPALEMQHACVDIVPVKTRRTVVASAVAGGNRSPSDIVRFSRAVGREPIDVMFFPAVYSWFPVPRRIPSVVTLHDAIAEQLPDLIFPDLRGRAFSWLKTRLAIRIAVGLVTVSEAARADIVQYIGVGKRPIDVICEGADERFRPISDAGAKLSARRRVGIPEEGRLLLYVGGIAPHKNLIGLLEGFASIAGELPDLRLLIVGDPEGDGFHSNYGEVVACAQGDPRIASRVHFAGFVSDDELPALYSQALALVLPSFSEGFGLPALEALACGTPVIGAAGGAVAEVAGDAGLAFNPHVPAEIGACIKRLATDATTRDRLRSNALVRAGAYSWHRAAGLTLACLERHRSPA